VLVLAGGGAAAWAMTRSSGSSTTATQLVAAKVTNVQQTVAASGTIEPAHAADLDFGVSGRVTAVTVKVGDTVRKGETLATVGTAALAADEAAAEATVTSGREKVDADGSASAAQVAADNAALTAAQSQLADAKASLADTTLTASMAGTVTAVGVTVGEQVSGSSTSSAGSTSVGGTTGSAASTSGTSSTGRGSTSSSAGSGSTSATSTSSSTDAVDIQSTRSFVVDASVDDTEVSQVKKGQSAAVTPDGATQPVTGTVSSVSTVPSSSSGVVTFPVTVTVSGHPTGVYAGASATLSITTKQATNVLEVPTLAVTYNGSAATVKVRHGGSTVSRAITVGATYGLETQVLSGLTSGEQVVVTTPTFGRGLLRRGTGSGSGGGGYGGYGGFGGSGGGGGFGGSGGGFGSGFGGQAPG
jgi:multidrug efflux pump subunit AcrA (membrane-fusion protein)